MDEDRCHVKAEENHAHQGEVDLESGSVSGHSIKSSRSSRSSRSSASSRTSIAATKARAEAQAAQARIAYAQREMDLKVEKARLEARLDILQTEKEAKAALVKAEVLEAAVELEAHEHFREVEFAPLEPISQWRVSEYVSKHSHTTCSEQREKDNYAPGAQVTPQPNPARGIPLRHESTPSYLRSNSQQYVSPPHESTPSYLRSNSQQYVSLPQGTDVQQHSYPVYEAHNTTTELARFLARSQLVTGGMNKYDDRPENYLSWKSTFLGTIEGLGLTINEEIDLMIKWLGPESSEQARRIKAVNVHHPSQGLKMIWSRIEECYGSPEAIERALFSKIENFPKLSNRDHQKLRELGDVLLEVEYAKQDGHLPGLSYLDTARGVGPIVDKLPFHLQERWMSTGSKYKEQHKVSFPPFHFFAEFVRREAKARNDPSFNVTLLSSSTAKEERYTGNSRRQPVSVHKTNISAEATTDADNSVEDLSKQCPIHHKPHPLRKCRGFRTMLLDDRKKFIMDNSICFRCCASTTHQAKNCDMAVKCTECGSERHLAALHPGPAPPFPKPFSPSKEDGGEQEEYGGEQDATSGHVTSQCTEVCGAGFRGKSCSKICLVNIYPDGQRQEAKKIYAILDDQSNLSLAKTEFFEMFGIQGITTPYTLKTCAGTTETKGRRAYGYVIESVDGKTSIPLPTLIECNQVPNNRSEIPTPEVALHHSHMRSITDQIPPVDPDAQILLLLGRDILRVHKVRRQFNGPHNAPYAQKLDLGWVIIGDVCLGSAHKPNEVSTLKTCVLENGRPSYLTPCESFVRVKENYSAKSKQETSLWPHISSMTGKLTEENIGENVFCRTNKDNQLAPSIEDTTFLEMMEDKFIKDDTNSWVAPLPFRTPRRLLPNNREYAYKRLMSLRRTLDKKPDMQAHYIEFMQKILDNNHAEVAPPLQKDQERWYLPTFGVYHPQKPGQIRVVFDSSAQFEGVSLNDVLLSGPDLNNGLLGVLLRFRKEPVALTADIEQMFYSFMVQEDDQDVLRFLWYRDNDLTNEVIDYRMKVHVFGNSPSPAVAIFGLRKAAREAEEEYGSDARQFIERDFYVDDALKSFPTEAEAIDVLHRARNMLALSNIKLHKIASNRTKVMDAFPAEDRAKDIKDLDLSVDDLPVQRSLGVSWNIMTDTFMFKVPESQKPFTRRGVLSIVNGLFDPLGFLAPVTIEGRQLLRKLSCQDPEWDSPLPEDMYADWRRWHESLQELKELEVPRSYASFSTSQAQSTELFVFSDASVKAIAAVAYLRTTHEDGNSEIGFILGKTKLAPLPELTIPRLELCAAVLAVETADLIVEELDLKLDSIRFFTDSKVVLGYIHNETRRFYVYVSNRVQRIRQSTRPDQWDYVPTEHNPADHGSRSVPAGRLSSTTWLSGPAFLLQPGKLPCKDKVSFELITPESDKEIRSKVTALSTTVTGNQLGSKRFERFSRWSSLTRATARLLHISRSFPKPKDANSCGGWHICKKGLAEKELTQAEQIVIRCVQHETYSDEIKCIQGKQDLPNSSPLLKLHPFMDSKGLLRVGGRISQSKLQENETNPLLIPGQNHIATLLIRHHHEGVKHQGRHLTEGAIRASGLWIVGAKRSINSVIHRCVTCRKLRRKIEHQQMADLPAERLQTDPPFTYVGLDVFGPWEIITRRTRGGQANSKRWAVLFTCMCTRAVHIEVIESMSSSSFINALRRFFSIRGPAKQLRSDCGTNFVGASKELKLDPPSLGEPIVEDYLLDKKCTWVFNPPHASHMGGAWERMIGIARRILESMFLQVGHSKLTHEVLTTLMAEVAAIINARPLVPVSSDPEAPLILTPSTLLTQKIGVSPPPPGDFTKGDMFKHQWKRVQVLADTFWARWRKEYLNTLQSRQKWHSKKPNLKVGDIVLMKDNQARRNEWPMGIILKALPSQDGLVRKVEIKVSRHQNLKTFSRPTSEVILLLSSEDKDL